jgi:hypothetical protein
LYLFHNHIYSKPIISEDLCNPFVNLRKWWNYLLNSRNKFELDYFQIGRCQKQNTVRINCIHSKIVASRDMSLKVNQFSFHPAFTYILKISWLEMGKISYIEKRSRPLLNGNFEFENFQQNNWLLLIYVYIETSLLYAFIFLFKNH